MAASKRGATDEPRVKRGPMGHRPTVLWKEAKLWISAPCCCMAYAPRLHQAAALKFPSRRTFARITRVGGGARPAGLVDRGLHVLKGKSDAIQVFGLDQESTRQLA